MEKIKIKRLTDTAKLPTKNPEDIGWDCYVDRIWIENGSLMYGFGIAVEPPIGYYVDLVPRSSLSKTNWVFGNSFGVIDPHYRGELQIRLKPVGNCLQGSLSQTDFKINVLFSSEFHLSPPFKVGDRVAQMVLRPIIESELEDVSELSETTRGDGGFGSTGK